MTELEQQCHDFLDLLREDGSVNMLQGPRAMQKAFNIDQATAKEIFLSWSQQKK